MPSKREVLDSNIHPGSVDELPLHATPSGKTIQRTGDSDLWVFGLFPFCELSCTRCLVTAWKLRSSSINLCSFATWLQASLSTYWFSVVTSQLQRRASSDKAKFASSCQVKLELSSNCVWVCVCLKMQVCLREKESRREYLDFWTRTTNDSVATGTY